MDIAINGENLTNGVEHTQDNAPVYTMSESVNKVSISAMKTPATPTFPAAMAPTSPGLLPTATLQR